MSYSTVSNTAKTSNADRAIASLFVAGVMFVLGYTLVRVSLAEAGKLPAVADGNNIEMVVPSEGTLWAEFGTRY